jgi:uncharacterized Zn finger protein (UPF0148 family)
VPEIACPKCAHPLILNTSSGMFRCANCGYKRPETLDEASERLRATAALAVTLTHRGSIDLRARSLFETGHEALHRGDTNAAIRAFQQAVDQQPDFADAHLWIAKSSPDERVQRDHLGDILAHDPGHLEALRLLMVLNGEMTSEEAERSTHDAAPILTRAASPVAATVDTLLCPVCGGDLTVDEANGRVVCRFCGHTAPLSGGHASSSAALLGAALLKRRANPARWIVGARILHCSQCGAERTIPAGRLSTVCPFCSSTQVIQQDALSSIEQPDGLVPFTVSEDAAKDAIRERLKGVGERLAGLFDNNQVKQAALEGIYLPFWTFDALAEVSRTTIDRRTPTSRERAANPMPYENIKLRDGLNGVTVAAVTSPAAALTDGLGEFDVSGAQAYEPKLLARYPAALYDVDFDAASLVARGRVSEHMRARHGGSPTRNVEVQVFTSVLQMSFTLLLLPVWVATLYERDGDVRPALVNGQSGQVALGKAQKPG